MHGKPQQCPGWVAGEEGNGGSGKVRGWATLRIYVWLRQGTSGIDSVPGARQARQPVLPRGSPLRLSFGNTHHHPEAPPFPHDAEGCSMTPTSG